MDAIQFAQGEPKTYRSSEIFERRFCPDCGSPLLTRYLVAPYGPDFAHLSLGTFDNPEEFPAPNFHFGVESHLSAWVYIDEDAVCWKAERDPGLAKAWASVRGD